MTDENRPTSPIPITVIMPVFNGADYIRKSLPPLLAMKERGEVLEVIVVDDVSTDNTPQVARALGAEVLTMERNSGPGAARNRAATQAKGDILWLVDADVVAHPDAAAGIQAAFDDPEVVAVFGSYDDQPPAKNFSSQYKNMIHHYYHQEGQREASTFWSGCGALRKTAFLAVGGFDVELFDRPAVEDIELGYRLRAAGGRISLVPEIQATHLKIWSFFEMIRTDIFSRAVPWARLMIAQGGLTDDLNVGKAERLRAVLAGIFVLVIAAAIFGLVPYWAPFAMFAFTLAANAKLFGFFLSRKGPFFALSALLFHQLYYLYSSAAFSFCWFENALGFNRPARAES